MTDGTDFQTPPRRDEAIATVTAMRDGMSSALCGRTTFAGDAEFDRLLARRDAIDTLLTALSVAEGDVKRMDTAQRLLFAADFEYGPDKTPVVLLRMPDGVGVSGNLRAFLDDAAAALPILATPGAGE